MRVFLAILLILTPALTWSEIYKRVDKDGNVYYSDLPDKKNAKPIKVDPVSTLKSQKTKRYSESEGRSSRKKKAKQRRKSYKLQITFPKHDEAIRANDGNITLQAAVNPSLTSNHKLAFYLDGKEVAKGSNNQVALKNVSRGSDTAQVKIIQNQKVISNSEAITFHLLRAIAH